MPRAWITLALLGVALGGCSSDFSSFSFGKSRPPPVLDPHLFPANYRTEIADFMRTYLNNPRKVREAFVGVPVQKQIDKVDQYITCVRYNPQDSKNQYEGTKINLAIFLGGKLNQFLPGDPQMCAGLNYQPFPEIENMVP
jgi:hypothetical protein